MPEELNSEKQERVSVIELSVQCNYGIKLASKLTVSSARVATEHFE